MATISTQSSSSSSRACWAASIAWMAPWATGVATAAVTALRAASADRGVSPMPSATANTSSPLAGSRRVATASALTARRLRSLAVSQRMSRSWCTAISSPNSAVGDSPPHTTRFADSPVRTLRRS
ncbi:hypothetical protein [Kutzneria kofuensis]|uniref:hypothetical protein n=1 Tax=Kutzneria kofuensis TaxID=103725 RepID=UPI0031E5467C